MRGSRREGGLGGLYAADPSSPPTLPCQNRSLWLGYGATKERTPSRAPNFGRVGCEPEMASTLVEKGERWERGRSRLAELGEVGEVGEDR